jgi:hypothetical protein
MASYTLHLRHRRRSYSFPYMIVQNDASMEVLGLALLEKRDLEKALL